MNIAGTEILTPYPQLDGDPTHYDPGYMAKIAYELGYAWKDADLPHCIRSDMVFQSYCNFIGKCRDGEMHKVKMAKREPDLVLAHNWANCANGSQTRYFVDALLLTKIPIEVIAADIGVNPNVIKTYERLFFNCRNHKDWEMRLACRTRTSLALGPLMEPQGRNTPIETQWRLLAAQGGYAPLVNRWGWEDAHGDISEARTMEANMQAAAREVGQRLRNGTLGNEHLLGVINTCVEYQRMLVESEESSKTRDKSLSLILTTLQAWGPAFVAAAMKQDGLNEQTKAEFNVLLAQHGINLAQISDKGMDETWHKMRDDQIKAKYAGAK